MLMAQKHVTQPNIGFGETQFGFARFLKQCVGKSARNGCGEIFHFMHAEVQKTLNCFFLSFFLSAFLSPPFNLIGKRT